MNINLDSTSGGVRGQSHAIFVVVPRFNIATLITTIETMRIANYLSSNRAFSWEIVSFDGAAITASNGMKTEVNADVEALGPADLIFVLGSWGTEHYANKTLISWLRKRARQGERVCSV